MNKLNIARILIVVGFVIGLNSWWMTVQHITDSTYLLIPEFVKGSTHAWYHAFREAVGDVAAMAIILFIFFGSAKRRTSTTWLISLILMIGYYAPFWIGTPFVPELAAPNWMAELTHILMAIFPVCGLFVSRNEFYNNSRT